MMINGDALGEAYTQAFETLRYYGNLRFTVLTAFILITGGLFTIALRNTEGSPIFGLFRVGGILIALVFGLAELRIAINFEFYGRKTETIGQLLNLTEEVISRPPGARLWAWIVGCLLLLIYLGALTMWIALPRYIRGRNRVVER